MDEAEVREAQRNKKFEKERAEAFEAMLKTPGWTMYQALLNAHVEQRTKNVFGPTPQGQENIAEHNKGVVYGLLFARDLPRTTVESTKAIFGSDPAEETAK